MTKQKAIDLLDNLIGFVEDNQNNDYDEALKMAIEALTENDNLKRKIEILEHDIKAQTGGMYIDLTKVNATA